MTASEPGRYAARGLSRERIVDAALAIVDEQGLAASTMRAVGERLGVRAMSLYKYVADRDAMFDADRRADRRASSTAIRTSSCTPGRVAEVAGRAGARSAALRPGAPARVPAGRHPAAVRAVDQPAAAVAALGRDDAGRLARAGFTDDQVLFAYRVFNSFLLGYLLLETSAQTLHDPKPGDGAFTTGDTSDGGRGEPAASSDPVPGGLAPTRSPETREQMAEADSSAELVEAVGQVDREKYPTVHDLAAGLAEDRWDTEFEAALQSMLERIEIFVGYSP